MTTPADEEALARYLKTDAGKAKIRAALQEGAAWAADQVPEGSLEWHLARAWAGLPPKRVTRP